MEVQCCSDDCLKKEAVKLERKSQNKYGTSKNQNKNKTKQKNVQQDNKAPVQRKMENVIERKYKMRQGPAGCMTQ